MWCDVKQGKGKGSGAGGEDDELTLEETRQLMKDLAAKIAESAVRSCPHVSASMKRQSADSVIILACVCCVVVVVCFFLCVFLHGRYYVQRRMVQAGEGIKAQLQGQVDERTIMKTFILPHFETAIQTATTEVRHLSVWPERVHLFNFFGMGAHVVVSSCSPLMTLMKRSWTRRAKNTLMTRRLPSK